MVPPEGKRRLDRRAGFARLAVLMLLLAAAGYGAYRAGLFELRDPRRLAQAIQAARELPALPLLFIGAYALAMVVGLPGTVFTLAGGAIFGVGAGSLFNWIGATIGAVGAYALARGVGGGAVRGILGAHASKLDHLTDRAGFLPLLRLRLIPVVPFNALNFAAGLAPVPLRPYVLSTALGIIPGTVVYTYFSDSLIAGATGARDRALLHVAIAGGLLIALSFAPAIASRLRKNRGRANGPSPP